MATTLYRFLVKRFSAFCNNDFLTETALEERTEERLSWNFRFFVTTDESKLRLMSNNPNEGFADIEGFRGIPVIKIGEFYVVGLWDDPDRDNIKMKKVKEAGWEMIPKKYHNMKVKEVEVA